VGLEAKKFSQVTVCLCGPGRPVGFPSRDKD
jgi:hypothetical protein